MIVNKEHGECNCALCKALKREVKVSAVTLVRLAGLGWVWDPVATACDLARAWQTDPRSLPPKVRQALDQIPANQLQGLCDDVLMAE